MSLQQAMELPMYDIALGQGDMSTRKSILLFKGGGAHELTDLMLSCAAA